MSDEPRKRSRFDQREPEPRRQSRFDRRSRSPPSKSSEQRRSRSPLGRESSNPAVKDPAAAAAAAAARINADLQKKKGIQHVDVPPIRSSAVQSSSKSPSTPAQGESYQQDGDYIKDIEVNDLRNRYTLTKGSTQKMIKEETGADVTTRGEYYPNKSMATAANPPLYLHVTSTTKEGLDKALEKINELMHQELPNLVDERRFRRREPEQFERDEFGRRKWPEERIPIDLEPIPGFNLRAQVVGHGGSYVKHIQGETRCRVQIKGRGSGFIEQSTGRESDEPMFLHVAAPELEMVKQGKALCEDLLNNVRQQYEQFKEHGPRRGDHYGNGNNRGGDRGHFGGPGGGHRYGGQQSPPYPSANASSSTAMGATDSGQDQDLAAQWSQYYAQNPQADPYAPYGGYDNYVKWYYAYYGQQQPGGQQNPAAVGAPGAAVADGAPPPPPSTEDLAPPPPPPGAPDAPGFSGAPSFSAPGAPGFSAPGAPGAPGTSGSVSYGNVPPPPGL